jgi:hypothetical protein
MSAVHEEFPQDIMQALRDELLEEPTQASVRKALKRMGMYKYFEHANALAYQLAPKTFKPILDVTPDERARIMGMFHTLVREFDRVYANCGVSFFSFCYVLVRLLEAIGNNPHGLHIVEDAKKRQWDAKWKSLFTHNLPFLPYFTGLF